MKNLRSFTLYISLALCLGIFLMAGCNNSKSSPTEPADPDLIIDDPLTKNKTSAAQITGGEFTTNGYKITSHYGYITYTTTLLRNIRIEFDAKGFQSCEMAWDPNTGEDVGGKLSIVQVFDAMPLNFPWEDDALFTIPFCGLEVRKRGIGRVLQEHKVDGMDVKWGGKGNDDEYGTYPAPVWDYPGPSKLAWDLNTTYHWVIIIQNDTFSVSRNGVPIFTNIPCPTFNPSNPLNVRIGGSANPIRWSPKDVTYSNVKIYRVP